jgi:hypothetical protein
LLTRYLLLANILFTSFSICQTNDTTLYFYHGKRYGSEANFNPLRTIINGGFGIMQISNRSNDLRDVDFNNGLKNVSYNLSHPFKAISTFGWKKFLTTEVIPTSVRLKNAQYYPNYKLHLIGGGFTYRAFVDWFRFKGIPHPKWSAFLSWFSYHFLNEIVENNSYSGFNVDPIADMYIFNTAGIFMFSFDSIARFFGNTLHMRDWSFQPAYDPVLRTIENVGQNFMIKIKLPFWKRWSYFNHWGVHGMFGLSYRADSGKSYSFAGGLVAKDLVEVENNSGVRELTTTLVWTAGLFYDLNNSLLTSLILSGTKGYKARVNVYPGVFYLWHISPGFFVNLRKDNQIALGLQFSFFPIGSAYRVK